MNPNMFSRYVKRIAAAIGLSKHPSRSAVASDLKTLSAALSGDNEARLAIESKFPSGVPVMAAFDSSFMKSGLKTVEMSRRGSSWVSVDAPVSVAIDMDGDTVRKMTVAGRSVRSFDEAASAYKYFLKNPRLATGPEDLPEPLQDVLPTEGQSWACVTCGNTIVSDEDFWKTQSCPNCKTYYEACNGCGKWYSSDEMQYASCPLCGYSSGGFGSVISEELPQHGIWQMDIGDRIPVEGSSIDRKTGQRTSYEILIDEHDLEGMLYPACSCMAWKFAKGTSHPSERTCKHIKSVFGEGPEQARVDMVKGYHNFMKKVRP
jgi:hypothetical protein